MIHTKMPRNCTVFPVARREPTLTRHFVVANVWLHNTADRVSSQQKKENHANLRHICVDHYILVLKHLPNHAFHNKRFQTIFVDPPNPRQPVPLSFLFSCNASPLLTQLSTVFGSLSDNSSPNCSV